MTTHDRSLATVQHNGAIVEVITPSFVDTIVASWLKTKFYRSESVCTRKAYAATIATFRGMLATIDADLDIAALPLRFNGTHGEEVKERRERLAVVREAARRFAEMPNARHGVALNTPVKRSTYNHRLAVVSSFYRYTIREGLLDLAHNPLDMERARVKSYEGAKPIPAEKVAAALLGMDLGTVQGLRDYAIISLGVATGQRAHALASLCLGDITDDGDTFVITWRRTKGGEVHTDELDSQVTAVLDDYLIAAHGETRPWAQMPKDTPAWRSFSRRQTLAPFSTRGIARVCAKWLGTSKIHAMRHTFARGMIDEGAPLTVLQDRLHHANLGTTGLYGRELTDGVNPFSGQLATRFGIGRRRRSMPSQEHKK